jgi:hypothetical protein
MLFFSLSDLANILLFSSLSHHLLQRERAKKEARVSVTTFLFSIHFGGRNCFDRYYRNQYPLQHTNVIMAKHLLMADVYSDILCA